MLQRPPPKRIAAPREGRVRVGGRGGGAIATCTRWSWRGTACCAWARPPHLVAATALTPPASPPSARSTGRPCAACRSCAGATRGGAGLLVGEPGRRARSLGAGGRRGLWGREAGRDRWTWATLIPILASALGGIFVGQVARPTTPCSRRSAWQASEPPTQPPPPRYGVQHPPLRHVLPDERLGYDCGDSA